MVEEAVEKYLAQLVGETSATGLFIGQSSSQREFVVMASRTPEREGGEGRSPRDRSSSSNQLDVEWVAEHARQVSRMLPGGLYVLGVFLVSPPDQAKEAQNTLRQLVFAVEKLISVAQLWDLSEDDVTDRVTLHVCSKTRKMVCRTFDVKDPKSSAKPADWRYQSGMCSSWPIVSCSVGLQLLVPLPGNRTSTQETERCIKKELHTWALQIQSGVCLFNGRQLSDDSELQGAQKKNAKTAQTITAQLCIPLASQCEPCSTAVVHPCAGSVCVKGMVHARAYLHGNKPKAKHAEKLIKRDVVRTLSDRVDMLLEELLISQPEDTGCVSSEHVLPRRVFCTLPVGGPGVCVCDYMFCDESVHEVRERLKEILDLEISQDHVDSSLEASPTEPLVSTVKTVKPASRRSNMHYCAGVAMATAVALLATATSLLYLTD